VKILIRNMMSPSSMIMVLSILITFSFNKRKKKFSLKNL